MLYSFDKENAALSFAPSLTFQRSGVVFYICASEDSGEYVIGAMSDMQPLVEIGGNSLEGAVELALRLFGIPQPSALELDSLRDAAMYTWQ